MAKRLPAKDDTGWPYCQWCRKNGELVPARHDDLDSEKPGFDVSCSDHRRRWTDDIRLTWEDFQAGTPCRGCGAPYIDAVPWSGAEKGTMYYTDSERAMAEAEQARFNKKHPDCHAIRHSIHGSLTTHCGRCCPPPPLSPEQRRRLAEMLFRVPNKPPTPLEAPVIPKPPTRKQLEARIQELEAEIVALQR